MENTESDLLQQSVPASFKRRLVACVNKALQDDLRQYMSEFHPDTKNAIPHLIGDWINKNIRADLASGDVDVIEFSRCGWKGKVIVDRPNHITFIIMRDKRFFQVRKEKRARPHYLQTMVGVLNKAHTAPVQQMTLFGTSVPLYDLETLDKDFDSIFCGSLDPNGGFTHCVVVYDTVRGELANIKILFPDKNLEIIEELSLNEYIRPDFAALSNIQPVAGEADDSESRDSSHLLSLKNPGGNVAEGSAETPARLREITEQDAI